MKAPGAEAPAPMSKSRVERPRREDRGAEDAEGDRAWGRVSSPPEGDMRRGLYPSPDFLFLSSKRRVLVPSGTDKTYFCSAWRLDFW